MENKTHCPECGKPLRDYHKANCSAGAQAPREKSRFEILEEIAESACNFRPKLSAMVSNGGGESA